MARAGELPVHVRVLIEGAEETGADDVGEWVRQDARGADAVIVFDSGMVDADTPALTLATRGMVFAHVEVRTGTQPAHSGMYGGAALDADHALHQAPAAVLPGANGAPAGAAARRRERRRRELEIAAWATLPAGGGRARPVSGRGPPMPPPRRRPTCARRPSRRWTCTASRAARRARSSCPWPAPTCRCGSSAASARRRSPRNLEQLLRDALPDGAELGFSADRAEASAFDPETPALRAARRALGGSRGREPTLCRTGGTLPILAAFAERGIPAIVSGFSLPDDALHAPNGAYRLVALKQGAQAARALYEELAGLK